MQDIGLTVNNSTNKDSKLKSTTHSGVFIQNKDRVEKYLDKSIWFISIDLSQLKTLI